MIRSERKLRITFGPCKIGPAWLPQNFYHSFCAGYISLLQNLKDVIAKLVAKLSLLKGVAMHCFA